MPSSLSTLTRQVIFAPLDDAGRTETVASRIRSAIILGLFADGEQLPNEITLAAQLAVSPVTLRDALRIIREEGLVRTVRGRSGGTFVVAPSESNTRLFENALRSTSVIELRDLIDWQSAVVCYAARLAVDRAVSREIEGMRQTIGSLADPIDAITARRLYSRFLIELSASARSSRISKTAISLQVEYGVLSTLVFRDLEDRQRIMSSAQSVLDAIAERRASDSYDRAVDMVGWVGTRIQEIHHGVAHPARVVAASGPGGAV